MSNPDRRRGEQDRRRRAERAQFGSGTGGPHGSKSEPGKHKPHDWFPQVEVSGSDVKVFFEYRYDAKLDRIQAGTDIVQFFTKYLSSERFVFSVNGFAYCFTDDVKAFAERNKMNPQKAQSEFSSVQDDAQQRLEMVAKSARRTVAQLQVRIPRKAVFEDLLRGDWKGLLPVLSYDPS